MATPPAVRQHMHSTQPGLIDADAWLLVLLYLHIFAGSTGFILSDKAKLDAELIRAASIDGLTNTLNRQIYEKRVGKIISLFAGRRECISFMLLDVEDHKVNDGHRRLMGNAVLRSVAATIIGQLRNMVCSTDMAARGLLFCCPAN